MAQTSKVDREIATIKADVAAIGHLFKKLDNALEKIGESTAGISQLLAVHEERLDTSERYHMERRKESDAAIKELHSRISTASRENNQALNDNKEKILEAIEKLRTHIDQEQAHLEERITRLEQWRWILIGILIAGSALFPNMGKIVSMLGN